MLLEEFNEQDYYEFLEERGREKGREQGEKQGEIKAIKKFLKANTPEEVIELGFDKELVEEAMKTENK